MGLDSFLARDRGGDSQRDHLTCEVPESAAVLFDSAVGLAFLGGLCRASMGSCVIRFLILCSPDGKEALICEVHSGRYRALGASWAARSGI